MTRCFTSGRVALLALAAVSLVAACNSGTNTGQTGTQTSSPTAGLTSGRLDTLYTDSATFVKLSDSFKVVFSFVFRASDTLTLDGWIGDTTFNVIPDIQLKNHAPDTSKTYSIGTYFGNVVLKKKDVKKLKGLLKDNNAHTVLFAPKLVNGNHIGYDVFLSKERVGIDKFVNVIVTGTDANPSPPKSY